MVKSIGQGPGSVKMANITYDLFQSRHKILTMSHQTALYTVTRLAATRSNNIDQTHFKTSLY